MTTTSYNTPIVLILFNRPDTSRQVFEMVRCVRPKKLLVIADGPRTERPGETEKCAIVQSLIKKVDWPCDLLTNISPHNMGCKLRVSSGLDWVFQNVDEAVILEDDCLPNHSFFRYCAELLALYRNDERIMHIGGANFQFGKIRGDGSYYFSRKAHVWGWATWKRAWKHYDVTMKDFPLYRQLGAIEHVVPNKMMQKVMLGDFTRTYENKVDTWDYQWTFSLHQQNGLSIIPNVNLVSNIGFGEGATHTTESENVFANVPTVEFDELVHPTFVIPDIAADELTFKLENPSIVERVFKVIRRSYAH